MNSKKTSLWRQITQVRGGRGKRVSHRLRDYDFIDGTVRDQLSDFQCNIVYGRCGLQLSAECPLGIQCNRKQKPKAGFCGIYHPEYSRAGDKSVNHVDLVVDKLGIFYMISKRKIAATAGL